MFNGEWDWRMRLANIYNFHCPSVLPVSSQFDNEKIFFLFLFFHLQSSNNFLVCWEIWNQHGLYYKHDTHTHWRSVWLECAICSKYDIVRVQRVYCPISLAHHIRWVQKRAQETVSLSLYSFTHNNTSTKMLHLYCSMLMISLSRTHLQTESIENSHFLTSFPLNISVNIQKYCTEIVHHKIIPNEL